MPLPEQELIPSGASELLIEAAREELSAITRELARRRHASDPPTWAKERLGDHLWSKQRIILSSVKDNRKTAVQSCHEAGKSYLAAVACAYWLDSHKPGEAFVVTSAPTGRQVRAILWREIGRAHSRGGLPGRTNQTEWIMRVPSGKEELVAFGQKPADMDPTAFQGIHARYVLVILDEACGIPKALWDAADSLIANDDGRLLAIGNPDDPNSEFAVNCRPNSGFTVIRISAFDTPNFTGEEVPPELRSVLVGRTWVEEKRKKWAPTWRWNEAGTIVMPPPGYSMSDVNPLWASKVLGLFPPAGSAFTLIPLHLIEEAQSRALPAEGASELGVDCGAGGDASVTAHRVGPVVRILSEDHNPNTMATTGKVIAERKATKAECVKVDRIGIGAGITDRGIELGEPFVGINVGEKATCQCSAIREDLFNRGLPVVKRGPHFDDCNCSRFANLKAQYYWELRERFERGDIDLDADDQETADELSSIRYRRTSAGMLLIESKDEAKRRGVPSPNRAEAIMLAFAEPPTIEDGPQGGVLW